MYGHKSLRMFKYPQSSNLLFTSMCHAADNTAYFKIKCKRKVNTWFVCAKKSVYIGHKMGDDMKATVKTKQFYTNEHPSAWTMYLFIYE